jgi:hypothetical protein
VATTPAYITRDGVAIKLTATSSMPCASWSLPAGRSCPGSKLSVAQLGASAVCVSCYAMKGFYRMGNVKTVQQSRMSWVQESLLADGGSEFVSVLVSLVSQDVAQRGEPIFRVHDSGDLFSVAYINAWRSVCEALPDVVFWFPTRSHILPNLLPAIQSLAALPNVTVRPSGLALDEAPPMVAGLSAGTTVVRSLPVLDSLPGVRLCPKTDPTDGRSSCGDCRTCWEGTTPVAYLQH